MALYSSIELYKSFYRIYKTLISFQNYTQSKDIVYNIESLNACHTFLVLQSIIVITCDTCHVHSGT